MSTPLLNHAAGWLNHRPWVRVELQLRAAGPATAACVWCIAVGSVGILGHGVAGDVAIGVLGVIALSVRSPIRRR